MKDQILVLPPKIRLFANREVRLVPLKWEHPLDKEGRPDPLLTDEMPDVSRLTDSEVGMVVYETTSEGTPCTPIFPRTPEGRHALLDYCVTHVSLFASHMGTRDQWERLLFQDELVTVDLVRKVDLATH